MLQRFNLVGSYSCEFKMGVHDRSSHSSLAGQPLTLGRVWANSILVSSQSAFFFGKGIGNKRLLCDDCATFLPATKTSMEFDQTFSPLLHVLLKRRVQKKKKRV